jgi:hypothetical protein
LAAAHAVIVVTAYFEAVGAAGLPDGSTRLDLSRADEVALVTRNGVGSSRIDALSAALLHARLPMPAPQVPYEVTVAALRRLYTELSNQLVRYFSGLAGWDRLDDTQRGRWCSALRTSVPDEAVCRYEEMFRRLAAEFPEFGFWAHQVDLQATRVRIRELRDGLAGMEQILCHIAARIPAAPGPDERRLALYRAYRAALARPILSSGTVAQGLRIPSLGDAYVNHDFRVAEAETAEVLADEAWWSGRPVRHDLPDFLTGYFTSLQASEAPLLLLGQPGAGKSVLSRLIAARLPPVEFVVVHVTLREVPAEADLQAQIEYSIRSATGESVTWPEVARSAAGALPVIILDGFDELVQATGVSQSDYLERVAAFQQREADQARPVAVMVTSRTAFADRARSVWGMVTVRLEPFSHEQVTRWLRVWNETNMSLLEARGLRVLSPERVMAHPELASQPLLLLMLALYDADDNALQRDDATLGHAELYERLLTGFAEREVCRSSEALSGPDFAGAVEQELLRLSVTALAMFNRHRQWVTEAELALDLNALLGNPDGPPAGTGLRTPLSAAQTVLGRFFFIHEAQATRDDTCLRTYEFLHATFGEYLIARLVARELTELDDRDRLTATHSRPAPPDDTFLYALLSFEALTTRSTIVAFLAERLSPLRGDRGESLGRLLLRLFHDTFGRRGSGGFERYQPNQATVTARPAAYSANLVLLLILVRGEITADDLFRSGGGTVDRWRRLAQLWRSQLPVEGFNGMVHTIGLSREWNGRRPLIRLRLAPPGDAAPPQVDIVWAYRGVPQADSCEYHRWRHYNFDDLRLHSHFMCDRTEDTVIHALEPVAGNLDATVGTFYTVAAGHAISPMHALLTLWLTGHRELSPDRRAAAYQACLSVVLFGYADPVTVDATQREVCAILFHQLATDAPRLPVAWLAQAVQQIREAGQRNPALMELSADVLSELSRYI